ncbi:MAG: hypothetical protein Q7W16_06255 [Coriobacteriia bacterium]|nr:hypothetical protein [Coriobacteriia bacterium]
MTTGWSKGALNREFGPIESEEKIVVPTVLSRWFVAFKDDLRVGRVDLEELIAVADADHQDEAIALCPVCSRRPVREPGSTYRPRGVCSVCWFYQLRDAHLEKVAELEAKKAVAAAKKTKQRLKDSLFADRSRRHKPFRICEDCGERLPARVTGDEPNTCPSCQELRERRHPECS